MRQLLNSLSRLERDLPRRIPSPRDEWPWLTDEGIAKVARACLVSSVAFYEVTRDAGAMGEAMLLHVRDLAERLRDDPSAEAEPLEEFETIRPEAVPTIDAILDRISYRGPRYYPGDAERRIRRQEVELTGSLMIRPLPPGMARAGPAIPIPDPTPSEDCTP